MTVSAGWWSVLRACPIRTLLSWHTLEVFMTATAQTVRVRVIRWSSASFHRLGNLQNCNIAGLIQLKPFIQCLSARFGDRLIKGLCTDNFRQQQEEIIISHYAVKWGTYIRMWPLNYTRICFYSSWQHDPLYLKGSGILRMRKRRETEEEGEQRMRRRKTKKAHRKVHQQKSGTKFLLNLEVPSLSHTAQCMRKVLDWSQLLGHHSQDYWPTETGKSKVAKHMFMTSTQGL